MANKQPLSPQGYNINDAPVNTNPFWEAGGGEPIPTGGLPAGGSPGQILEKASVADYDAQWVDPTTGGVTLQQVRAITDPIAADVTANKQAQDAINVELWAAINENVPPDLTALTERVATVETNLATEVSDRVAAIAALQAQIDAIESADIEDLQEAVEALQSELAALQVTVDAIDISGLENDLAALTLTVNDNTTRIDDIDTTISGLTGMLNRETELRIQGDANNASAISAVAARVTALETWKLSVDDVVAAHEADIEQLQADLAAESATRDENDDALSARIDEAIAQISDTADSFSTLLAQTRAELENEISRVESTLTIFQGQIADLQSGLGDVTNTANGALEAAQVATGIAESAADDVVSLEATFNGGIDGQVLTRTGTAGYTWADPQGGGGGSQSLQFTNDFLGFLNIGSAGVRPNPIGTPIAEATHYDVPISSLNVLTAPYVTFDIAIGNQLQWGDESSPIIMGALCATVGATLFNATNALIPLAGGYVYVAWNLTAQTLSVYPFSNEVYSIRGAINITGRRISLTGG